MFNPFDPLKKLGGAVYRGTPLDNVVNIGREVYTGATTDAGINYGNIGRNIAGGLVDTALILGTGGLGRAGLLAAKTAGKGGFRQVASGLLKAGLPIKKTGSTGAARVIAGYAPGSNRALQIGGLGLFGASGYQSLPEIARSLPEAARRVAGLFGGSTPQGTAFNQFPYARQRSGTPDQIERARAATQGNAQPTAGGSAGGGTTGGSAGATPEDIGMTLPGVPPEFQAELDRQTIGAQTSYEEALNRIAQQRTSGSVSTQEAIRAARRAGTGGAVDIAAEAAEAGLGSSPGIIGVAQDMLRQREATDVSAARKRFLELAAELGMTNAQAKRALDSAISNIGLSGLTARAQAGMNFIPQIGGN